MLKPCLKYFFNFKFSIQFFIMSMNCTVLAFQWLCKIKKLKNNSGLENSSDNGVNRQANSFKRRQFVKTGTKLKGLIIEILAFCFLRIFEYFFISLRHFKIKTNCQNIFWNVSFFYSSQFWNFMLLKFQKIDCWTIFHPFFSKQISLVRVRFHDFWIHSP